MRPKPTYLRTPKNIAVVPVQFRFQDPNRYPQDNTEDFEWWLSKNLRDADFPEGWTYLPITWTAYYKKCNYCADAVGMRRLQEYIDGLPRHKKYFSVCQWDDGVRHDVSSIVLHQFNMGAPGHYQLPLICQPHQYSFPGLKRDIICSFVGRITHPIRQKIVDGLSSMPGYYISTAHHSLHDYCKVLAQSKYTLACRGYGQTSFRVAEALQYGSHVIYPSDFHLNPHNQRYPEIKNVSIDDGIAGIVKLVSSTPNPKDATSLFNDYFTYESCKKKIINNLQCHQES